MPAHSDNAGRIMLEEAYAASKMLDNSGWNGILRSGITPSDIDHPAVGMVFDNRGAILLCDFSISSDSWEQIARTLKGQRWLYDSLINHTSNCAVLCKHSVSPDLKRPIDTLRDVERFHLMVWDFGMVLSNIYDGAYWQAFVTRWVNDAEGPRRIRRTILGESVGLIRPKAKASPPTES